MHRVAGRVVSLILLLVLGLALSRLALRPGFDPPSHYAGDDDDAGLIWKTLSQSVDLPSRGNRLGFIPSASTERQAPGYLGLPQFVARDPLGSRAPPPGLSSLSA